MKNMKQINIGTCVPGQFAERWLPVIKDKGYECFAINFHMGYYGVDLKALAPKVNEILADTDTYVSTIGYYCNALENESQLHDLEFAIDNAHLFGAKTVATFAGALEGKDVPSAIPRFKEVYSELARRAEANGVKLAIENCPMGGTWNIYELLPAFLVSALAIVIVSLATKAPSEEICREFDSVRK